ncbi:unnamed protein product [marine sediment metagenome]|uniref:Uncharacterized protein n=1 Tax=marine sediment metagenome TaxID=412755 RepID=X0SEV2_9ZZZZ
MAYISKSRPKATLAARVFEGPNGTGRLLADLGIVAGGDVSKEKMRERKAKLAQYDKERRS